MQLVEINNRFVLRCTYDQKEVAKSAGFKWDPSQKQWYTTELGNAAKLSYFADEDLRVRLQRFEKERDDFRAWSAEMSKAKEGTREIPCPDGKKYAGYQIAGIEFAAARKNTLIADEPGLGKTIEAVGLFNFDNSIKTVLIICPGSVTFNWLDEWNAWAVRKSTIAVCNSVDFPYHHDIVIISYDRARKQIEALRGIKWDLLICDESHNLKNSKAKRTALILGGTQAVRRGIESKRYLFLTGTPVLNRPNELWTTLHKLDPKGLGADFMKYHIRYCDAKQNAYGWDFSGRSNLTELNTKLRESIMIRRTKEEVLSELPPKRRQMILLDSSGVKSIIGQEMRIYQKHQDAVEQLKLAAANAANEEVFRDAVRSLRIARTAMFEEMSALRHKLAIEKIPFIIEHLSNVVTPENKVVFFAHHLDVIKAVEEAFDGMCVTITGSTNQLKRRENVKKFQEDKFTVLFVGNLIAAGVGITLHAASHVVTGEFDWRPAIMTQAEDRCHRMGQRNSVLVQHLVFEGSLDALMAKKLLKKQETLDAVLDGKPIEEVKAEDEKYADDK